MKKFRSSAAALFLSACGNPGGISDSDYAKYKELGAPKILYSCTREIGTDVAAILNCNKLQDIDKKLACLKNVQSDAKKLVSEVDYAAGVGVAVTYNRLLGDAKAACENSSSGSSKGEFKILESKS